MALEALLRAVAEQRLVNDGPADDEAFVEASRALVAVCGLPEQTAREVLDSFEMAQAEQQGPEAVRFLLGRRRNLALQPAPPLRVVPEPPIVLGCDTVLELPHGRCTVSEVIVEPGSVQVAVEYDELPAWSGWSPSGEWIAAVEPTRLPITDDEGVTVSATWQGGGGPTQGWSGVWLARELSPTTGWLDLDGERLNLPAPEPALQPVVRALPERPLVWRYLWHHVAVRERCARLYEDTGATEQALLAAGALLPDDPELDLLHAVEDALTHDGSREGLPQPWASAAGPGPARTSQRSVAFSAVVPELEGRTVVLSGLRHQPEGALLGVRVIGPNGAYGSDRGVQVPPAWWAHDDLDRWYLGAWSDHGDGPNEQSGHVLFGPLDADASHLELHVQGLADEAVVTVPLSA